MVVYRGGIDYIIKKKKPLGKNYRVKYSHE